MPSMADCQNREREALQLLVAYSAAEAETVDLKRKLLCAAADWWGEVGISVT